MTPRPRAPALPLLTLLLVTGCAGAQRGPGAPSRSALAPPSPVYQSVSAEESRSFRGGQADHAGAGDDLSVRRELGARPDDHRLLAEAAPAPTPTPAGNAEPETSDGQQAVADTPTSGPLLIYEAEVNLAVHEVRERMGQVIAVADELGGFLATQDDTSVVIRVPAVRFRQALERIETLGDVLRRRISAEDVSDQVRDVRIRLQNAIQMRDRLAELLARASTVPESLTIEQELERLTESIELMRGQLRVLQDRVAFSTITVRFEPVRENEEVPRERFQLPFPWLNDLGLQNLMRL